MPAFPAHLLQRLAVVVLGDLELQVGPGGLERFAVNEGPIRRNMKGARAKQAIQIQPIIQFGLTIRTCAFPC